MLARLQRGLEQLYRIDTKLEVEDFLIDEEARQAAGVERMPREQLLLAEEDDGLSLGLFVDRDVLAGLAGSAPGDVIRDRRLGHFLLVVEGVSHFVYVAWRAQADRQVSALELELQAEVDKYVTCVLSADEAHAASPALRRRLFEDVAYEDDLDDAERDRYRVANDSARSYAVSLEQRFVASRRMGDMLRELRHFWRMSLPSKLDHIQQAA